MTMGSTLVDNSNASVRLDVVGSRLRGQDSGPLGHGLNKELVIGTHSRDFDVHL